MRLFLSVNLTLIAFSSSIPAFAANIADELRQVARPYVHQFRAWRADVSITEQVRIPVTGQSSLHASLYLPKQQLSKSAAMPTILVMLPYGRHEYGEALRAGIAFGAAGFAVITLDLRGYASEMTDGVSIARPLPWQNVGRDASATLDWITAQPWSNGKVGTFGCSALGETQFALARENHPAHAAMLVAGAGGALGQIQNRFGYFGLFEGGIFQLASGYGWLAKHGWLSPPFRREPFRNPQSPLTELNRLPVTKMIESQQNAWQFITGTPLKDPSWASLGYISDQHPLNVPLLTINTWADQTLAESIRLHNHAQGPGKRLVLGPGSHCDHERVAPPGANSVHAWQTLYNRWFEHWLREPEKTAINLAPVSYLLPGQSTWRSSTAWPPTEATLENWYLHSDSPANSVRGAGRLFLETDAARPASLSGTASNQWVADPNQPVPSLGGPVCCTNTPVIRSGSVDQAVVEARNDVLVFTSEIFEQATDYAGPVTAQLYVSSSGPDTDLIVRITDVAPDGRSMNIQEGAQRVSLRSEATGSPMQPGQVVSVKVHVREIAHRFERGHRLRLHVAASSFPRLARNLQSGGFNRASKTVTVATQQLHHTAQYPSSISLYRLPGDADY